MVATARAQAPSCAWGSGVALPGVDNREALITDDGGAGVLAVAWTAIGGGLAYQNQLRFFHVLEQGKLDPSLPANGVLLIDGGVDLPERPEVPALRMLPDGQGGAYILVVNCNSTTAHMRCYELADARLLHVTAAGTPAPGWPALGLEFDVTPVYGTGSIEIVLDSESAEGPRGVIVAWIDGSAASMGAQPVLAQRFAPDATPLWPGGVSGDTLLAGQTSRYSLAMDRDRAGGCVVVVTQLASGSLTRLELRAGRLSATGESLWTTAGKAVITLPTHSASYATMATDALGRSFVTARMTPAGGTGEFYTQLLSATGARAWGLFGIELGLAGYNTTSTSLATSAGLVSLHDDPDAIPRFQLQDEFGGAYWGSTPDGVPADWTTPPTIQRPLVSDGHVISLFTRADGVTSGVRAIELDEGGGIATGWPADGVSICAGFPGQYVTGAIVNDGQVFVALGRDYGVTVGVPVVVQRLSRAVLDAREDPRARALELAPPAPNPSRGAWLARISLREPAAVTLEAFDIAGRRALQADLGSLPAGRHALEVRGGASLAPGVYRIRVRAGAATAERVLVRVH